MRKRKGSGKKKTEKANLFAGRKRNRGD